MGCRGLGRGLGCDGWGFVWGMVVGGGVVVGFGVIVIGDAVVVGVGGGGRHERVVQVGASFG